MSIKWVKILFVIAGLYDLILGIAFIGFASAVFAYYGVEPPNHMAYVKFPALLLLVFAAMYFRIACNPILNRELILFGCGLKVSYVVIAFWYELTIGIPSMWMPWAWADLAFLVLFVIAWVSMNKLAESR